MDQFANSKLLEVLNKLIGSNSQLVQYQAVSKLYSLVVTDLAKNETEKKKLLNKLVEVLGSISSKHGCSLLIEMLLKLAKDGVLSHEQLISSFLIVINSKTDNAICCLEAITQLALEFQQDFASRYSIRNPSHPFIEVLRNSDEDFGQLIFNQIRSIFEQLKPANSIPLLKPVLIHLFLLNETPILKHRVAAFLIKRVTTSSSDQDESTLELISLYLSCLKNHELKSPFLLEAIEMIGKYYENCDEQAPLVSVISICDLIGLLIKIDQVHGFDCSHQLQTLQNSISKKNDSFKKKAISSELMNLLATNLPKIGLNNLMSYLNLVHQMIIDYKGGLKIDLVVFIPGLLSWNLCIGSIEWIDSFQRYRQMCSKLMTKIEENNSQLEFSSSMRPGLLNLIEYEQTSDQKVNFALLNELCAHFILNEIDLDTVQKICSIAFKKLVNQFPNLYPTLFCLYILKIRKSQNPQIINYLFNSIVDLVGPKIDLSLCLNVLKSLMAQESTPVKLMCMKLMTKLCTLKFDYLVYPFLSKDLLNVPQKTDPYRLQALYTKAFCIFEIVSYRPDYYAQELLATISALLNSCSSLTSDQGVCSLLIESLAVLCESQVLDIKSTWNALNPQYRNETRSLALSAYCRFMAVVCKLDHIYDSQNEFYLKMVQSLWSIVEARQQDATVVNSALKEMSKFKKDSFKVSYFPVVVVDKLRQKNKKIIDADENKDKSLDEIFPLIPAACYIDLFYSLKDHRSYQGLKELFTSILSEEIDSMPRRIKSLAREKVFSEDEQRAAQLSFFDHLRSFLVDECHQEITRLTSSDADFNLLMVLFAYDAPGDRNREGKLAKRHIKSHWENYEQTLGSILNNSSIQLTQANLDLYKNGFLRFIRNAYFSFLQAMEFENEAKTDTNFCLKARDQLTRILVDAFNKKPTRNQNDMYLLVLLVIVQISTEHVMSLSSEAEPLVFQHRKWVEVLIDFILNIRETQTGTTESEYINQFNYNQVHSVSTLKFLFAIYDDKKRHNQWTFLDYFMVGSLGSCTSLRVSSFLIQYVEKIVSSNLIVSTKSEFAFKTIAVFVRTLIERETKFDMEKNTAINSILKSLLDEFSKADDSEIVGQYLSLFVECLFCLYNDESVFYDDENLLSKLLDALDRMVFGKNQRTEAIIFGMVYLSCLAYKSNLIGNDKVQKIYEILIKDSKFNKFSAFFSRFLLNYGFYDALVWIKSAHQKWHKFYVDFKLNLETDVTELAACLEGMLVLISGISIETVNLNMPCNLAIELESTLKTEATIKDLIKFIRTSNICLDLKTPLSYLLFKKHDEKYDQVLIGQNTFDYLDNQSILRAITNEALRISKETAENSDQEAEFQFFVSTLAAGCRLSSSKLLPPINWLNLVNTLIKSRFGSSVETDLIELVLYQVGASNSAFVLVKNYLIDTNHFSRLLPQSQKIVLVNLTPLFEAFNDALLKKFLAKLKLFLAQKNAVCAQENGVLFAAILDSIYRFFASRDVNKKDDEQIKYREVVGFFTSVTTECSFWNQNIDQDENLKKVVKIVDFLKDERVTHELISLNETTPIETHFLVKFYIRAELSSQYGHPLHLLNDPIQRFFNHIELVEEATQDTFVQIFAKCLMELVLNKTTNAKNSLLNWLIEFINSIRSLASTEQNSPKSVKFGLVLYQILVDCVSVETIELYNQESRFEWAKHEDFERVHERFFSNQFWRQLNGKIFDFLISIVNARNCPKEMTPVIKRTIKTLFTIHTLNDQMWLKFANMINKP